MQREKAARWKKRTKKEKDKCNVNTLKLTQEQQYVTITTKT